MSGRRQPVELTPANHAGRDDHYWWVGVTSTFRCARCCSWTEARDLASFLEREFMAEVRVTDFKPTNHREIEFDWRPADMVELTQ